MRVSDHRGLLRARVEGEQPITPVELFFDLVFVFAVTQAHRMIEGRPILSNAGGHLPSCLGGGLSEVEVIVRETGSEHSCPSC